MNTSLLEERWDQLKGRLKEVWQDLTEADQGRLTGRMEDAVNYLQNKYGQTKEAIIDRLHILMEDEDGYGEEE